MRLKILIFMIVLSIAIGAVYARVGSIDEECQKFGYGMGIAKWEWNDDTSAFEIEDQLEGYNTEVNGDEKEAFWTAGPGVNSVLVKQGRWYHTFNGDPSGHIAGLTKDISHITFCAHDTVPEFSTLTAGIALLGAVVGYTLIKKKR